MQFMIAFDQLISSGFCNTDQNLYGLVLYIYAVKSATYIRCCYSWSTNP